MAFDVIWLPDFSGLHITESPEGEFSSWEEVLVSECHRVFDSSCLEEFKRQG